MAEYIDRDALIKWLKSIPLKDLSDGLGLCRVIMEDDFKKSNKENAERHYCRCCAGAAWVVGTRTHIRRICLGDAF